MRFLISLAAASVVAGATGTISSRGVVTTVPMRSATFAATSEWHSGTVVTLAAAASVDECAAPRRGWIWCDDFEQDRVSQYFEYDNPDGAFVRGKGAGRDGSYGMRAQVARGQVSAGALHLAMGGGPGRYFRTGDAGAGGYREGYWRRKVREPARGGGGG